MLKPASKKYARPRNENGFTLVEALISFSIFCTIALFLPLTFRILSNEKPIEMRIQRLEWEVFVSQIKKEIRMSNKVTVLNQSLVLEKSGQMIIYERYGSNLRRRVDNKGHEILLQKVSTYRFEKLLNGLRISLTDEFGQEYVEEIRTLIRNGVP
jgi:competence protein ComGF